MQELKQEKKIRHQKLILITILYFKHNLNFWNVWGNTYWIVQNPPQIVKSVKNSLLNCTEWDLCKSKNRNSWKMQMSGEKQRYFLGKKLSIQKIVQASNSLFFKKLYDYQNSQRAGFFIWIPKLPHPHLTSCSYKLKWLFQIFLANRFNKFELHQSEHCTYVARSITLK